MVHFMAKLAGYYLRSALVKRGWTQDGRSRANSNAINRMQRDKIEGDCDHIGTETMIELKKVEYFFDVRRFGIFFGSYI